MVARAMRPMKSRRSGEIKNLSSVASVDVPGLDTISIGLGAKRIGVSHFPFGPRGFTVSRVTIY